MKLENQVCNLELAKKLKELGVKQKSLFYWFKDSDIVQARAYYKGSDNVYTSAFTVAELGELLSKKFKGQTMRCMFVPNSKDKDAKFRTYLENDKDQDSYCLEWGATEADCRAKMLIYLLENKLIKI